MKALLPGAMIAACLAVTPALAQPPYPGEMGGPPVTASPTYPNTGGGSPGIPGPEAVNPAPGARGPYVGAGRHGFYDVDARIAAVRGRIAALPPGQRHSAMSGLRSIKSEEATQRARHGGQLRDWDRENINHKLDMMMQRFPALQADNAGAPPQG